MKLLIEKVLGIEDGEHHYVFDVPARDIGIEEKDFEGHEIFDKLVRADVTLTKTNHVYYIRLKASSEPRLLCDRCLTEIRREVQGTFEVVYSDMKSQTGRSDGEIRLIDVRRANEIALDKDVADTLLLAMPSKVLCREDCRGLCAQCGADLNTEPCEHERAKTDDVSKE